VNGEKRLLIEKLIELAENNVTLQGSELDELKARFMMITSSSAETMAELEHLSYEAIEEDEFDGGHMHSGLALAESHMLLSSFFRELSGLSRSAVQGLSCSYEEFQAGITATWVIVESLQWSSSDDQHIAEYDTAMAQRSLDALVRSLDNYRATGEP
jgi:hypothetical protein